MSVLIFAAVLPASPTTNAASKQEPPPRRDQQAGVPAALPKGKKLVLTDGSYQMVGSYERRMRVARGDFVERRIVQAAG